MPKTQDEKNTEELRKMLQQPGNKRCFDCQSLGPVYVVLDFGIFVCQTCSGIQFVRSIVIQQMTNNH